MKKIGILTLVGDFNYGNRLQNFALQEIINKLGYEVDSLKTESSDGLLKKILKKVVIMSGIIYRNNSKINTIIRGNKISKFSKENIKQSVWTLPIDKASNIDDYYYCFVVGSDQVWNPNYNLDENYFLDFTNKKKISYAASLGVSALPQNFENKLTESLNGFDAISVREKSANDLLQNKVKKTIEHVLDPTLLLTKEEWLMNISKKKIKKSDTNYILLYFLGGIEESVQKKINELSNEYNLKILNLMDSSDQNHYAIDPFEFVLYIKNSRVIFTDSFHGTVFAIIFNKPFITCERILGSDGNMTTRIESLLETLNLTNRQFENQIIQNDWLNIDYTGPNKILEQDRKKSIMFLRNGLE